MGLGQEILIVGWEENRTKEREKWRYGSPNEIFCRVHFPHIFPFPLHLRLDFVVWVWEIEIIVLLLQTNNNIDKIKSHDIFTCWNFSFVQYWFSFLLHSIFWSNWANAMPPLPSYSFVTDIKVVRTPLGANPLRY